MAVMNGSLIPNAGQLGALTESYIANLESGGQNGFGPVLPNLDASTPQVYKPLQFFVTHVPTLFEAIPNGTNYFKALFETHLVSMDGLDYTSTMETSGTPIGRDSQEQHVPVRQNISQITPTCNWAEKLGSPIFKMLRIWMDAMSDRDTQAASMPNLIASTTQMPPHVASMYAADILGVQYDTTYRSGNVVGGFFMTNFFPTDIGSPGYQYNTIEARRIDRSATFHCVVQDNNNTIAMARDIAAVYNLHTVRPMDALPVAQSIDSQIQGEGLQYVVEQVFSKYQNLDGVLPNTGGSAGY